MVEKRAGGGRRWTRCLCLDGKSQNQARPRLVTHLRAPGAPSSHHLALTNTQQALPPFALHIITLAPNSQSLYNGKHPSPDTTDQQPPSRRTEAHYSAVTIIVHSPHLIGNIPHYMARSSLATCLRVNKHFHEEAGKVLYHTVRIDGSNMAGFFHGALAGTSLSEDSPCLADSVDDCHRYPLYDSDDNSIREAAALPSANGIEQPVPNCSATNFKGSLLAHVRVLSVGTHHTCVCYHYGEHVAPLLYNLHTLRAVPTLQPDGTLGTLCDETHIDVECRLFTNLAPLKLVLRNLDDNRQFLYTWPYNHFNGYKARDIEYITVILPPTGPFYSAGRISLTEEGLGSDKWIKLIFSPWEYWGKAPSAAHESAATLGHPSPMDVILSVSSSADPCVVVGLETIQFSAERDELVAAFKSRFPSVRLDSDRLRQLVKDELWNGALQEQLAGSLDFDYSHVMIFRSLDEYTSLPGSARFYELHDGLPPWRQ